MMKYISLKELETKENKHFMLEVKPLFRNKFKHITLF